MKHFNENYINKLTYPKKLNFFLSDFDTLFYKHILQKEITFSSSLTFFHQN